MGQPSLGCRIGVGVCAGSSWLPSEVRSLLLLNWAFLTGKLISQFLKLSSEAVLPHLFLWDLLAQISCGMRRQPCALRTGFVGEPSPTHDHSAGHDRSRSIHCCCRVCRCAHEETETSSSPVHPPAWTSDGTALTSQPCCLGTATESVTSGEEQKCFEPSTKAKISGG